MELLLTKEHKDHSGCRAVNSYLRSELSKIGQVVTRSHNPDLVVVNGEGSFNHNYGRQYLSVIKQYTSARKVLVNALWQDSKDNIQYLDLFSSIFFYSSSQLWLSLQVEMIFSPLYPLLS